MRKIVRVLIVDDSALVRQILTRGLGDDPGIEVVGTASDPYGARDLILKERPDVMTLDVEMPKMNGVDFLRKLMPQYPIPVVMVSSLTDRGAKATIAALEAGAIDFVAKPKANQSEALKSMMAELRTKVKVAATARVGHWKHRHPTSSGGTAVGSPSAPPRKASRSVIAIGASTGGTEAIRHIITQFPTDLPGTVIVQHMPAGFTKQFADRLNEQARVEVREAQPGDQILTGRVLIAPGGRQMKVIRVNGEYRVDVRPGELCCGHCPSVEVMMQSVARSVGRCAVGAMLTGMGADGADGMLAMRQAGARCIAQDEASCIVYGMPKEAYERGGAEKLVSLNNMAATIIRLARELK